MWLPPAPKERAAAAGHPLLGQHLALAGRPGEHVFHATVSLEDLPFLADHAVQGAAVMPAAAYVEMAVQAAKAAFGEGAVEIRDLELRRPLVLEPQRAAAVQVTLSVKGRGAELQIHARQAEPAAPGSAEDWATVAVGTVRALDGARGNA
jgi:acyl transferase domain-containing protein